MLRIVWYALISNTHILILIIHAIIVFVNFWIVEKNMKNQNFLYKHANYWGKIF